MTDDALVWLGGLAWKANTELRANQMASSGDIDPCDCAITVANAVTDEVVSTRDPPSVLAASPLPLRATHEGEWVTISTWPEGDDQWESPIGAIDCLRIPDN